MVTCNLKGGLGNQMFQIATTIGYAMKHNMPYEIPENKYFNHLPKLTNEKIEYTYKEPKHPYQEIPFSNNICLDGYFQTEKYFNHCRQQIIYAFKLHPIYNNKVSIHVRRGDYLKETADRFPVIDNEYIKKSINYFNDKGYNNFLIFSDDINWCKKNINSGIYNNSNFKYSEDTTEIQDLRLMSGCEHNIISNSTFSWWGAWLNQNPNKIVIAPKKWFGKEMNLDSTDICPANWIRMSGKEIKNCITTHNCTIYF